MRYAFLTLLFFSTWKYDFQKDDKKRHDKINSQNWEKVHTTVMEQKKDVESRTDKVKPQLKTNSSQLNTKDGPFFKSAFTSVSGSIPLDTVFILLLIDTSRVDLDASISTVYNHFTLASVIAELAFCATVFAVYKWKRVQRENRKKPNMQLQEEFLEKNEDQEVMEQVVNTLMELKRELENQKGQLKEFLENIELQREENKQKLQAVEKEITEIEMTSYKPEELLGEKENLLKEQWKLDQIKKDSEKKLLNTERLLEPIEMQVTRIQERRK